jgi:hypothetical protein
MKYYIISPEHMHDKNIFTFWAERACGYTVNMDKAMVLTEEELAKYPESRYPRWPQQKNWFDYEDFIVSEEDLSKLATPMRVAYRV